MYKFINNYETKLTAAIVAADTSMSVANDTPIVVGVGDVYRLTLQNEDASIYEIVDVTAKSGSVLTIERGKEGTSALNWSIDTIVICSITAAQVASIGDIELALDEILGV